MPRIAVLLLGLVLAAPARAADNELTPEEKQQGYVLLFDGKDLSGFRKDAKREYNKWLVTDGVITLTPAEFPKDPNFTPYPLWTVEEFGDYMLKFDFRTAPDPESGHSAVILRPVGKPGTYPQPALEVAILGSARKPGVFCTGAFRYGVQAVKQSAVKPAGEWNSFVITMQKEQVAVELNGVKVNDLNLAEWTSPGKRPDGSAHLLTALALKDLPKTGPVGFRDDYGIPVWFKNLRIKPLR